jgi:hypothetical protein
MLFDLIAMKIRDEDDQFAEFSEILNFLKMEIFQFMVVLTLKS